MPLLADDVELGTLVAKTEGFVGADLEGVCRQAALSAIRDYLESGGQPLDPGALEKLVVTGRHLAVAITDKRGAPAPSGRAEKGGGMN
jgi:transitional endoplasmic reticulum ATPase